MADATDTFAPAAPTPAPAITAAPTSAADTFPLTLQEFCMRLSSTDKRVELIGAFEHTERIRGAIKNTEANFAADFAAFADQPA